MEDYRKSDPDYTAFVPTSASEAIDLFTRYKRIGVPPSQWPETFCHVSRALPDSELDRFHEWLVCPQGCRATTGPTYAPCPEVEAERAQLANGRARQEVSERASWREAKGLEKPLQVGPDPL